MITNLDNGIAAIRSRYPVEETVERLKALLAAKGITLFAVIDHSGEAEKAGLSMRPTKLLIVGSPKAGTPVMTSSPGAAIDLPLKVLVSEDVDGEVYLSYNTAAYLQARHAIPDGLVANLAGVEDLVKHAAG